MKPHEYSPFDAEHSPLRMSPAILERLTLKETAEMLQQGKEKADSEEAIMGHKKSVSYLVRMVGSPAPIVHVFASPGYYYLKVLIADADRPTTSEIGDLQECLEKNPQLTDSIRKFGMGFHEFLAQHNLGAIGNAPVIDYSSSRILQNLRRLFRSG